MSSNQLKGRAAVIAAAAVVVSVGAGAAWGAIPDEDGTIDACYRPSDGVLRVIDVANGQRCKKGEEMLTWDSGADAPELADGVVTESTIADGAVTTPKIADGAVNTGKIADGAVTTGQIADGTILNEDVSGLDGSKISGTLGSSAFIAAANITGMITSSQIAGGLTGSQILDGTITAADLAGSDAGSVAPGAVTSEKILDGTVERRDLADGAVSNQKLADGAVSNQKLADGAVSNQKLADGAVSNEKLASPMVATYAGVESPVTIPAGIRQAVTFNVPGVAPGDFISVAPPALQGALVFGGAAITAPNVVTVYIYNPDTLTPVDVHQGDVFEFFTIDLRSQ